MDSVGVVNTPAEVGPVNLGLGRTAVAIAAGDARTCAILDTGQVRCWAIGNDGRLGLGDTASVGATNTPADVVPIDLGPGRTAVAVSAAASHTCVTLDTGAVGCWGAGGSVRLGYGSTDGPGGAPATVPALNDTIELAGRLAPRAADLSLLGFIGTPTAALGGTVALVHTITNAGPDAARAVVAAAPSGGLVAQPATPSVGTIAPDTGVWDVGRLAPGQSATLVLPALVVAPGDPAEHRRDHLLGRLQAGLDARQRCRGRGRPHRRVAQRGNAGVGGRPAARPDGDGARRHGVRSRPADVRTAGGRGPAGGEPRDDALGTRAVRTRVTAILVITRAPLRLVGTTCRAIGTLSLPRARVGAAAALRVTARFTGNALLTARAAPARSVRLR